MNWKLNGNDLPGWHSIKHLNITNNSTYNRLEIYPYYFHHPFVSNQKSWQRTFSIDSDIDYDYLQIEFDIFTFCGNWNPETDSVGASIAFAEYLQFMEFWRSTHSRFGCEGYQSPKWDKTIDIVRINEGIHDDLSCYAKDMVSPTYECTLNINTIKLLRKEGVDAICNCQIVGGGKLEIQYLENEHEISSLLNISEEKVITLKNVNRDSRLRLFAMTTNDIKANGGGIKCNISVLSSIGETQSFITSDTSSYWSIINTTTGSTQISTEYTNSENIIWSDNINDTNIIFQFSFNDIFVEEYELSFTNGEQINITNSTNITQITFAATPLTTCHAIFKVNGNNITNITIDDGLTQNISSSSSESLYKLINNPTVDYIFIEIKEYEYECRLDLFSECNFNGQLLKIDDGKSIGNILGNTS